MLWLFVAVFLANLILSYWALIMKPVLAYDGVRYILAAQAIANNNWGYASELYSGTLYPFLIYLFSTIFSLNFEYSAHLLNSFCFTLISFAFIFIVRKLGGTSTSILLISALVIVFFPSIIRFRPYIFRDYAFLACYLWSIFFLLSYYYDKKNRYIFYWLASLGVASLFRKEGLVFLLLLSVFVLGEHVLRHFREGRYATPLFMLISALLGLFVIIFPPVLVSQSAEPNAFLIATAQPAQFMVSTLQSFFKTAGSATEFFTALFDSTVFVLTQTLRRLEVIYAVFIFFALKKKLVFSKIYQRNIIISYAVIAFLILVAFDIGLDYFASRYVLAFALTLMLLVPFYLEYLFNNFRNKKMYVRVGLVFLIVILGVLSLKRFEVSDQHLEATSGAWAVQHLKQDDVVVSNNSKILFYAKRYPYLEVDDYHTILSTRRLFSQHNKEAFANADYLILMVQTKDVRDVEQNQKMQQRYGKPIQHIVQNEKEYVNVYKLN